MPSHFKKMTMDVQSSTYGTFSKRFRNYGELWALNAGKVSYFKSGKSNKPPIIPNLSFDL